LITGGAGFIGSHLCERLLDKGYEVDVIDNLSTGRKKNITHLLSTDKFEFFQTTIMNEWVLEDLINQNDVVYHLAAAVGVKLIIDKPVETIETNIRGTENVLKFANKARTKVLIASSSEVYGILPHDLLNESDDRQYGPTTAHRWSYAASKAIDEFLALAYHKEYNLPVIIARLFNTVGPRQVERYGMVLPNFVKQALTNEPITIYGDGKQSRSFTYVGDCVNVLIGLMESEEAPGQVFNIGNSIEITIEELAQRVKELSGSKSELKYIPYEEAYESGFEDMQRRCPDNSKIGKLLGYKPSISLDELIKITINYHRELMAK
ncbi:MAG: GDP-mannose 4,6-dehydratase, partial [Calditrichia bacterium]|nr:GDP-mannose 4,6-dehydratase [Calditrichia bacterium]